MYKKYTEHKIPTLASKKELYQEVDNDSYSQIAQISLRRKKKTRFLKNRELYFFWKETVRRQDILFPLTVSF